ncbi:hypothetical protein B0H63DRAFT_378184, partial [Podospora didyma]
AANPPATTRPPPLELPTRTPETSTFSYLVNTGKAYLNFYKTGIKQIWTNTQLVRGLPSRNIHELKMRAEIQLLLRWQHDIRRVPIFGLLMLVCGEFTPFVVMAVPSIVPFTCRIPKQVFKLQQKKEQRRKRAQLSNLPVNGSTATLVSRSLGLMSPFWDRFGKELPYAMSRKRFQERIDFLAADDELIRASGGVDALEADEVRLACNDRGFNICHVPDHVLQQNLRDWL